MKEQVIIAGFGGQGVMMAGMLLAYTSMLDNKEVTWLPSYGPEMRGGTANCNVVISDKQISSPIINCPDTIIVMNKPSLDKYEDHIHENGSILINSSLIDKKICRNDIKAYYIPINEIAMKLGNSKVANIIMMGAYFGISNILPDYLFKNAINKILRSKNEALVMLNVQAFERGKSYIQNLAIE